MGANDHASFLRWLGASLFRHLQVDDGATSPPFRLTTFPQGVWTVSSALTWRRFEDSDDWLVYNERSAQVHLVSPSAHVLWQLLSAAPMRLSIELVRALAERLERLPDAELTDATVSMLHFMDDAGLILPIPG